jgi:predicted transposase YbfD/YdcC
MSDAPIKTLYLKGTLTEGIKIKLYPFSEFQQGRWNICISQMIFHLTNEVRIKEKIIPIKDICAVSCNFIKVTQYSEANELQTVFQNLNIFLLQGTKNDKKLINFEKKWSLINNSSEELKLYVTNLANSDTFQHVEANFYFIVLLQRIN